MLANPVRVQRGQQEVARAVAREHAAGAVRAVRGRRQPDQQQARVRIAEARARAGPSRCRRGGRPSSRRRCARSSGAGAGSRCRRRSPRGPRPAPAHARRPHSPPVSTGYPASRQARMPPSIEMTLRVAHLLQVVGRQRRAEAAAAVEDDRRVLVGDQRLDVALEHAAADVAGAPARGRPRTRRPRARRRSGSVSPRSRRARTSAMVALVDRASCASVDQREESRAVLHGRAR